MRYNSYFLVWLVVTRLVLTLYFKHSLGLPLSYISVRFAIYNPKNFQDVCDYSATNS